LSTVVRAAAGEGPCGSRARPSPALEVCPVVSNTRLAPATYRLRFFSPSISRSAIPGRFLHIDCRALPGARRPILRRPFSVSDADAGLGWADVVYRVVGPGTEWLSSVGPGESVDVLGPLGNGFSLPRRRGAVLIVSGGIGIAPLLGWARRLTGAGHRVHALVGARTRDSLVGLDYLSSAGAATTACTDDGSVGFKGTVCELLHPVLRRVAPIQVYACGPSPVLRAVQSAALALDIPCEISVEDRIACGIGACVGCAVPKRHPSAGSAYFRACADGPVFNAADVAIQGDEVTPS
jgi:dihydroorotate dehydrogenase electron transfer subunit